MDPFSAAGKKDQFKAPFIDISMSLENDMLHWPGDPPFEKKSYLSMEKGDLCNVSLLASSSHIGTHVDAPRHFLHQGETIEKIPLDWMVGKARVFEIGNRVINVEELIPKKIVKGDRVLFKTMNSRLLRTRKEFFPDYVHLSIESAKYLAGLPIRTVGIDSLSIGGFDSKKNQETHQILLKAGICIIEGLDLLDVAEGEYTLVCLPLKISGGDGAPARAILQKATSRFE
ncbi:MAG: cyclase family protein [Deltaproteobacteria bacterium]|nr:cyclase family protein [Deltaproteobacteria bacterium]